MSEWENILKSTVDGKRIFGASICIEDRATGKVWQGAAGDLKIDDQYFVASTTKLYITALVLILEAELKLSLDDRISKYLSSDLVGGLHPDITVGHLMAQTSGISDYFQSKPRNGASLEKELMSSRDRSWSTAEAVAIAKNLGAKFPPGKKNQAHYSDTNYQLLGKIIEQIETGLCLRQDFMALAEILHQRIFKPLELERTYLYVDPKDQRPADFYFKTRRLHLPLAMVSFGADGGIVSTASESLNFLTAFFDGRLFPKERIEGLRKWNRIFFPLQYGVGLMRFKLPRIFSPLKAFPELIGHSGLSGAFEFYCPERNLFLAGTVNQLSPESASFKLMLKFLR